MCNGGIVYFVRYSSNGFHLQELQEGVRTIPDKLNNHAKMVGWRRERVQLAKNATRREWAAAGALVLGVVEVCLALGEVGPRGGIGKLRHCS